MQVDSIISQKLNHYDVISKFSDHSILMTKNHHYHPRTLCNNTSTSSRLCVAGDQRLFGSRIASRPFNLCWVPTTSFNLLKVYATAAESDQPKWWEKSVGPNMIVINSTQEFLDALSKAGDRLVIVDFYGTWCGSCRGLFPKICKIAMEHPDIVFLKVNFDENKSLCKSLNVKVLPYFHFYRGADGLVESFSCSLAKLQKFKDAITNHNKAHCSESLLKVNGDGSIAPEDKPSDITSR